VRNLVLFKARFQKRVCLSLREYGKLVNFKAVRMNAGLAGKLKNDDGIYEGK